MIFAVSGASGTGKTTLCKAVAERLDIRFQPTSITEMGKRAGIDPLGNISLDTRLRLQESILQQFGNLLKSQKGPVILDRSPIDLIGYMLCEVNMHSHGATSVQSLERIADYVTRCTAMTDRYIESLFFVEPLGDYKPNAKRPALNPAYQIHTQTVMLGSAIQGLTQTPTSIIRSKILEERTNVVSDMIKERIRLFDERRKKLRLH